MDLKTIQNSEKVQRSDITGSISGKKLNNTDNGFSKLLEQQNVPTPVKTASSPSKTENLEPIQLGTITNKAPTVSHLLKRNGQYSKDCWKIIYAAENKHKNFRNIKVGTKIFLDPKSKEIIWNDPSKKDLRVFSKQNIKPIPTQHSQTLNISADNKKYSQELDEVVKPYLGLPYNRMNCYSLLVKGLKNLGVHYTGKNGLRSELINMAQATGQRRNAFFNGEGIIEASGQKIYKKSINHVTNPDAQARQAYSDIKPLLAKGDILAFSIHTAGHTGIVSQKDDDWTFINSGKLNNSIHNSSLGRGVGEENLGQELSYWFNLAAERKESLLVTVGRLENEKLVRYMDNTPKVSI